ncbi:MAG: hypothetical protein CMK99_07920 [Pseudomonas sp.]|nr:hypothetical protein [Pseudomonas sp.]
MAFGGQTQEFFAGHVSLVVGEELHKVELCKRTGQSRQEMSGAPAPTGQGLDDIHPLFAGDHHDLISAAGFKRQRPH